MSWNSYKLGDVCEIARGGSPRPIDKYLTDEDDGVNWIKIGDATRSKKYIFETKEKIKQEGISRSRIVKDGDFLLSNSMSFGRPYIMRTAGCIHDGWLVLSNYQDKLDIDFFYYLLSSPIVVNQFEILAQGSTVRNLNKELVSRVEVKVPPLSIQRKIVAKLDAVFTEIDKATAAAEANAKNAEALFQSLLKRVFECDDEGWNEVTIGSLYKVASSKRVLKSDWKSEGVPFYRGREITSLSKFGYVENDLFITEKMYSEYSLNYGVPSADDIMVTAIGTIGNTYIVKNDDKFYFKDASVLWLKKEKEVDSKFVNYWFKSSHFTSQLHVGLGATVDTLTIGKVSGMRIKIPNLSTQKDVVAKLDALSLGINKSSNSYTGKANELANLTQSILRQAFAGELIKG